MKLLNKAMLLGGALALSLLFNTVYAAPSAIKITSEVHELVEVKDAQGRSQLKMIAADGITPGDRILFTTTFKNDGKDASDNVVITNRIPRHTRYQTDSARGEHCIITFSVDGGRVWGDAKKLTVRLKDGKFRAATAADYTHIRWRYKRALQPAEKRHISFETKLL